ncbi:hypothetical protein [Sorangium sp. So ce363]|uniref:hypothetical protein n=1 Tax=Sorangium sp. So ce363 TaxID=3133304 RepID=UPI003F5EDAF3
MWPSGDLLDALGEPLHPPDGELARQQLRQRPCYGASIRASVCSNELLAELSRQGAGILGRTTPAGARLGKAGTLLHLISQDLADSAERRAREVFGA